MSGQAVLGLVSSILGSFAYGKIRFDEGEEAKRVKAAKEKYVRARVM